MSCRAIFLRFCFLYLIFVCSFFGCDQNLTPTTPSNERQDSLIIDLFSLSYYYLQNKFDYDWELTAKGETAFSQEHLAIKPFVPLPGVNPRNEVFVETTYKPSRFECWLYRTHFLSQRADSNLASINNADIFLYGTDTSGARTVYFANTGMAAELVKSVPLQYHKGEGFLVSNMTDLYGIGVLKIYYQP